MKMFWLVLIMFPMISAIKQVKCVKDSNSPHNSSSWEFLINDKTYRFTEPKNSTNEFAISFITDRNSTSAYLIRLEVKKIEIPNANTSQGSGGSCYDLDQKGRTTTENLIKTSVAPLTTRRHSTPTTLRHSPTTTHRPSSPATHRHTSPATHRHTSPATHRHTSPATRHATTTTTLRHSPPAAHHPSASTTMHRGARLTTTPKVPQQASSPADHSVTTAQTPFEYTDKSDQAGTTTISQQCLEYEKNIVEEKNNIVGYTPPPMDDMYGDMYGDELTFVIENNISLKLFLSARGAPPSDSVLASTGPTDNAKNEYDPNVRKTSDQGNHTTTPKPENP